MSKSAAPPEETQAAGRDEAAGGVAATPERPNAPERLNAPDGCETLRRETLPRGRIVQATFFFATPREASRAEIMEWVEDALNRGGVSSGNPLHGASLEALSEPVLTDAQAYSSCLAVMTEKGARSVSAMFVDDRSEEEAAAWIDGDRLTLRLLHEEATPFGRESAHARIREDAAIERTTALLAELTGDAAPGARPLRAISTEALMGRPERVELIAAVMRRDDD